MNKKLFILSLAAGIFFTGCETSDVSEETQTEARVEIAAAKTGAEFSGKIHQPDWMEGPGAEIHVPDWMEGPGTSIHTPDWTIESWFACEEESEIPSNVTVPSNKNQSYASIAETSYLNKINVGGTLNFCGFISSANTVNLHRGGVMNIAGILLVGTEEEPEDLVINYGSHLNFVGEIIVTGDLIVNNGGTLEQMDEHSSIEVGGELIFAEGAIINGVDHDHDHDHEH